MADNDRKGGPKDFEADVESSICRNLTLVTRRERLLST